MVRTPSVDKNGIKRGAWSEEEDSKLKAFVERFGHLNWRQLPKHAGLMRCGKSCRLRWMNYLRPGLKKGNYSLEEEELIIKLHKEYGNRWSVIAARLPGRSDNDVKNQWHTHLKKRAKTNTNNLPIMEQFSESSQSGSQSERSSYNLSEQEAVGDSMREVPSASLNAIDTSATSTEVSSTDLSELYSSCSLLNRMEYWIEEDHISSMQQLPADFFNFCWTNPIYNFQTEPLDNFQTETLDHFWRQPFF